MAPSTGERYERFRLRQLFAGVDYRGNSASIECIPRPLPPQRSFDCARGEWCVAFPIALALAPLRTPMKQWLWARLANSAMQVQH